MRRCDRLLLHTAVLYFFWIIAHFIEVLCVSCESFKSGTSSDSFLLCSILLSRYRRIRSVSFEYMFRIQMNPYIDINTSWITSFRTFCFYDPITKFDAILTLSLLFLILIRVESFINLWWLVIVITMQVYSHAYNDVCIWYKSSNYTMMYFRSVKG